MPVTIKGRERIDYHMKNSDKQNILCLSTQFKFSLFKEGLRQLKIGGIFYTLLCAVLSIITVSDNIVFNSSRDEHVVANQTLCNISEASMSSIALCSAIFIIAASLILLSFLRSSKSRDFYCSTPNSVCTLWLNFTMSIMTWTAAGILTCNLIQLPFMLVSDVKYFMTWLTSMVSELAFALLITGIVSLALSLTGKIIPALITIASIALLPTMLYSAAFSTFSAFFNQFCFIVNEPVNFPDIFSVLFRAIVPDIYPSYGLNDEFSLFSFLCSSSAIIYNLLLGVVYLAIAAWFMTIRTGDSTGRPFVNKAAHIISLLAATFDITAIVSIVFTDVICDRCIHTYYYNEHTRVMDTVMLTAICLAAIFIAFWICEIILTFNIKKSYRALKLLPIPIVAAAVITGVGYLCFNADIRTAPKADEIKSVTLVRNDYLSDELAIFRVYGTYGRLVTNEAEFTDKQIINYVSDQIGKFVDSYDKNIADTADHYNMYGEYQAVNLKINLKNGRSITRSIEASDDFIKKLESVMSKDSEYMEDFLALPDAGYTNIGISISGLDKDDILKIYQSFSEEYAKMSNEDKLAYMKSNLYSDYYYGEEYDEIDISDDYYSEFILEGKSQKQGDYSVFSNGYSLAKSLENAEVFSIYVSGYKDSRFYDSQAYFSQAYSVSGKYFPKTISLLIEICNENLKSFSEIQSLVNENSWLSLDAYYYGKDSIISISYDFINACDAELITESSENSSAYFYDEETGESYYDYDEGYTVKVIPIDGNACVKKLFDDAAKTDKIDISKPYCKLNVSFYENTLNSPYHVDEYTVFIQTDSLIDLLDINLKTKESETEE